MKKNTLTTRIYKEEKEKLTQIKREMSLIENKDIKNPEVLRRILNIPSLPVILKTDSMFKKQRGVK